MSSIVPCSVGDGHLGLEGAVDHLDHLERDAGDGAGDSEDDDSNGAEGVADGEQRALKAEGVAEGKSHERDGEGGELANFGEAGVAPSVLDPRDVAANEDAEEERGGDVDGGVDQRGDARRRCRGRRR